jgi:Uri superfamily endonuclease
VTPVDLPDAKGTYVLIAFVAQAKRVEIGSLGAHEITPGYYIYVGSAHGAGGLRARIGHHLESAAEPHWHIDYLLRCAEPTEIWYAVGETKLERHWVELFESAKRFRTPIRRFGSSDYHRSRSSHLFYSKRQPAFRWFREQVLQRFDGVEARQCLLTSRQQLSQPI